LNIGETIFFNVFVFLIWLTVLLRLKVQESKKLNCVANQQTTKNESCLLDLLYLKTKNERERGEGQIQLVLDGFSLAKDEQTFYNNDDTNYL
jgi:hypothetical protein